MAGNKEAAQEPDAKKPEEAAAAPKNSKKMLFLVGGGVGILGSALAAVMMAVPGKHADEVKHLAGPFVSPLAKKDLQVNLAGNNLKRYLVMSVNAEFNAYEEGYFDERIADPLYDAMLQDTLLGLAAMRTADEMADSVMVGAFLEELREKADALVFPVEIGHAHAPATPDGDSGLLPGLSIRSSTFRGLFEEHCLTLDGAAKTIQLDGGASVTFKGDERDLMVQDAQGDHVFVDVTKVHAEFKGEVHTGTQGQIRKIFRNTWIIQ
jgi:hypothetical protein